ncbi:MAG: Hpt domain-containing protein, partial [Gammaproteobacteria bacterium]|nr:Hpt domain-containing protein [Gammaproteobacteria bacterium]
SDAAACAAAGIDDLVVKPFSPEELCRRFERLLRGEAFQSTAELAGDEAGDWLDPSVLAEHFDALGPRRTARILQAFETSTGQMLAALADPDGRELADPAHRLAGSAATLGLPRLRALAVDLERAARTGTDELDTLSALMPAAIEASHRHIDAYWSSLREEASVSSM